VQKILAQLFLCDFVGRFVEMLGELAHRAYVHLLCALGHAGKLQVFDHATAQLGDRTEFRVGRHGLPPLRKVKGNALCGRGIYRQ
jgi:hypothetical protein